jgi:hypothetical protein
MHWFSNVSDRGLRSKIRPFISHRKKWKSAIPGKNSPSSPPHFANPSQSHIATPHNDPGGPPIHVTPDRGAPSRGKRRGWMSGRGGGGAYAERGEGGGRHTGDALAFGLEEGEVLAFLGLVEEPRVKLRPLRRGALADYLPPQKHCQRHGRAGASPRAAAAGPRRPRRHFLRSPATTLAESGVQGGGRTASVRRFLVRCFFLGGEERRWKGKTTQKKKERKGGGVRKRRVVTRTGARFTNNLH